MYFGRCEKDRSTRGESRVKQPRQVTFESVMEEAERNIPKIAEYCVVFMRVYP